MMKVVTMGAMGAMVAAVVVVVAEVKGKECEILFTLIQLPTIRCS
jgi:hypothetical protein